MNIQPYVCCEYCDVKKWGIATVNTAKRIDLFTGEKCTKWRANSDCKNCGMSTYWHIDPDQPYEPIDNVEGQTI